MKYHFLIIGMLIVGVLCAGCSDESDSGTATPVPTTMPVQPKFIAGDIVAKTATSVDTYWLIIKYDPKTDNYERALIFRSLKETWYRKDNKTELADRSVMEKLYPVKIFHTSSISAITLATLTATPTATLTTSGPEPTITGITPNTGTSGFSVSITNLAGTNFRTGATVKLMGTDLSSVAATNVVVGEKSISCTFNLYDLKEGKYTVVVTNPDGKSATLTSGFTINTPGPVVAGINPAEGMIGQSLDLTITGSSFKDPAKVIFHNGSNQFDCTNTKVTSATQITCYLPAIPSGTVTGFWDIEVKNIEDKQNGTAVSKFNIRNATA
ncbi:MAG: IPT/TIG domain-containing protein [Methanoregula sp.]|nr:MAG: IPT/TIG domain-containing protein [Methanoregula sp.]